MILAMIAMIVWLRHLLGCLVSTFRSRQDLILENLASVSSYSPCTPNDPADD
jgi:hypothetical protein